MKNGYLNVSYTRPTITYNNIVNSSPGKTNISVLTTSWTFSRETFQRQPQLTGADTYWHWEPGPRVTTGHSPWLWPRSHEHFPANKRKYFRLRLHLHRQMERVTWHPMILTEPKTAQIEILHAFTQAEEECWLRLRPSIPAWRINV